MLPERAWQAARASYGVLSGVPGVARIKSGVAAAVARTRWTAWARLEDGTRLRVDMANTVGRSIWFRGAYDDTLVRFIVDPLRAGDAFLDVGANVGYYTALAGRRVGTEGRVFAIEPAPRAASLLADSVEANGWDNVILLTVAATHTPAILSFRSETNSGWSRVEARGNRVVAGAPLDTLVGPLVGRRRLRTVKIDVEGHELEALSGMEQLLRSDGPERVLTEAHLGNGRPWLERLFGFFRALGYRAVDPVSGRSIGVDDVSRDLWNVGFVR